VKAVCDIETDGIDNPQNIWVAVFRDLENPTVPIICHTHDEIIHTAEQCDTIIGHNFIGYDHKVLTKLVPGYQKLKHKVVDTLILSRLLNFNLKGGHSLENWGLKLGFPKNLFNDFSKWSQELEDRCIVDTELNVKLYNFLLRNFGDSFEDAIEIEHFMATVCEDLHTQGFPFNRPLATRIHKRICRILQRHLVSLQEEFPPRMVEIKTCTPRLTKEGRLHKGDFRWLPPNTDLGFFSPGVEYSLYHFEDFNPRSHKQVIDRLLGHWDPYVKTDGRIKHERAIGKAFMLKSAKKFDFDTHEKRTAHFEKYGWKINEENLQTLRETAPQGARKLAQYLLLDSRRSVLEEWLEAFSETTGHLHGKFNPIGAWTHRMSHFAPNQGNIPALDSKFGKVMRQCFQAGEEQVLVGVDAEGIQLRILAHYINDPEFTAALIEGNKHDETDAHSLNALALGFEPKRFYHVQGHSQLGRDIAKTFIYAWLLGAGVAKIAEILGVSNGEATERIRNFVGRYPGLKALKEEAIPRDGARGYFVGLDGRKVVHPGGEHYVLAGYLQNGESLIMKYATRIWMTRLKELAVPYSLVNFVHDEWQTLTTPEWAQKVGLTQCDALTKAGQQLNCRCPQEGNIIIGNNWKETH
jgi:DNA polymerase-1